MIAHDETCLLQLRYFKEGGQHLAVVTKVETGEGDPYLKKIGLITLEDIIEEILDFEIEDEFDGEETKNERKNQKEQLLALFTDRKAAIQLTENERKAVQEFLSSYVTPFSNTRLKYDVLEKLVE